MSADRTQQTFRTSDRLPCSDAAQRSKTRNALWDVVMRSEEAQIALDYKVAPLLAMCELATKATHTLSLFASRANLDPALHERLRSIEPSWKGSIGDVDTQEHMAQCLQLARHMCTDAAAGLKKLASDAADAMRDLDAVATKTGAAQGLERKADQ